MTLVVHGKFGFMWNLPGSPMQIQRVSSVRRSNGIYRCLGVKTNRDDIQIYVTPSGKTRVYRNNEELK